MNKRKLTWGIMAIIMVLTIMPMMPAQAASKVVYANTAAELKNAIASNTEIVLSGVTYAFDENLSIYDVENLTITGTSGARFISRWDEDLVVNISNCKNISISNVSIGADTPKSGGFFELYQIVSVGSTENVVFDKCDIFGSSSSAFWIDDSLVKLNNCTIRDCSDIGIIWSSAVELNNCVIRDMARTYGGGGIVRIVKYSYESGPYASYSPMVTFNNCEFLNNNNSYFKSESFDDSGNYNEGGVDSYNTGFTKVTNCTFTACAWHPSLTAIPTSATVLVNGANVAFDAYNIGGSNYFKLRDIAFALSGTEKQFDVEWRDPAIMLTSGKSYTVLGGEMEGKGTGNKTPTPTNSAVYLDGKEVLFSAYYIEGNNYFKLRDIGETFDFGVDWDGAAQTIRIDTSKGYTPDVSQLVEAAKNYEKTQLANRNSYKQAGFGTSAGVYVSGEKVMILEEYADDYVLSQMLDQESNDSTTTYIYNDGKTVCVSQKNTRDKHLDFSVYFGDNGALICVRDAAGAEYSGSAITEALLQSYSGYYQTGIEKYNNVVALLKNYSW